MTLLICVLFPDPSTPEKVISTGLFPLLFIPLFNVIYLAQYPLSVLSSLPYCRARGRTRWHWRRTTRQCIDRSQRSACSQDSTYLDEYPARLVLFPTCHRGPGRLAGRASAGRALFSGRGA